MRFLVGAALLATVALGATPSGAQTSPAMTESMGSASPLGGAFGNVGIPESAAVSLAGRPMLPPCVSGNNLGSPALVTFDGGGLGFSSNGSMSAPAEASSMATDASATCSAVTTSGVNTSSSWLSFAVSNSAGAPGGISSIAGLGTGSLGTTSLGTTSLIALPTLSASTSQATSSSTGVSGSPTFCAGGSNGATTDISVSTSMTTAAAAQSDSGVVRDPALGVGSGLRNPAQALAGEATLPTMNAAGAPCLGSE